jgi:hypothetical protein
VIFTSQGNEVLDQNTNDCQARSALLSGNGAQINNIFASKDLNGKMSFEIRSQDGKAHSVMIVDNEANILDCPCYGKLLVVVFM